MFLTVNSEVRRVSPYFHMDAGNGRGGGINVHAINVRFNDLTDRESQMGLVAF